jgi:hypothetical protein
MLYWTDGPGVDGYYVVVIHPTQLFMRTVHENPNPSKLYFVVPLSAEQYDGLVRFLKAYEGQIFSDDAWSWPGYVVYRVPDARESPFHPDNPSDEEFTRWYEAVEDLARSNLRVVMSELNNALPTDAKLPALPSFLAGTQRPTILD